jgi:hypothetical protein
MKPRFLLQIDLSGITTCNKFFDVPSIIKENTERVLFRRKNIYSTGHRRRRGGGRGRQRSML